jgi:hypothetical protein
MGKQYISKETQKMSLAGTQFGQDETARVAYQLWLERGSPQGSPEEDWFRAEQLLHASD